MINKTKLPIAKLRRLASKSIQVGRKQDDLLQEMLAIDNSIEKILDTFNEAQLENLPGECPELNQWVAWFLSVKFPNKSWEIIIKDYRK